MFANALPEKLLGKMGRIHLPRPITIQSRQKLLGVLGCSIGSTCAEDNADLPAGWPGLAKSASAGGESHVLGD